TVAEQMMCCFIPVCRCFPPFEPRLCRQSVRDDRGGKGGPRRVELCGSTSDNWCVATRFRPLRYDSEGCYVRIIDLTCGGRFHIECCVGRFQNDRSYIRLMQIGPRQENRVFPEVRLELNAVGINL